MTIDEALKELKEMGDETDIYDYETEEDKANYINWLKNIGAWEELTPSAQEEIAL